MEEIKKSKKSRVILYLILFLFFLSLVVFSFSIFKKDEVILDKRVIILDLNIGDKFGFDLSEGKLSFGAVSRGASSFRDDLVIKNNYPFPIKVEFDVKGNISEYLIYEKLILLEPLEEKKFLISTVPIEDQPYGSYFGELTVVFKKSR